MVGLSVVLFLFFLWGGELLSCCGNVVRGCGYVGWMVVG